MLQQQHNHRADQSTTRHRTATAGVVLKHSQNSVRVDAAGSSTIFLQQHQQRHHPEDQPTSLYTSIETPACMVPGKSK
jgi:hypothetical protein